MRRRSLLRDVRSNWREGDRLRRRRIDRQRRHADQEAARGLLLPPFSVSFSLSISVDLMELDAAEEEAKPAGES
jgi:hypothetical protein